MCIYEQGLLTYSIEEVASFPQPYSFSLHSFHSAVFFGNKSWNFFEFPAAVPALDLAMLWPVLPSYFSRCACYQALRILCGCNFHCSGQACLLRCCDTEAEVRFFSPFFPVHGNLGRSCILLRDVYKQHDWSIHQFCHSASQVRICLCFPTSVDLCFSFQLCIFFGDFILRLIQVLFFFLPFLWDTGRWNYPLRRSSLYLSVGLILQCWSFLTPGAIVWIISS